jgi:exodeoxyribonuclease-3
LRVVALNIRHGGGQRIAAILEWLGEIGADLLILSEWRANGSGKQLCAAFEEDGFRTNCGIGTLPHANGLLVASRRSFESERVTPAGADKGELLLARWPDSMVVLAAYFPQSEAKAPFFDTCMAVAARNSDVPLLLIGDLNTGSNSCDVEGNGTPFACEDLFLGLETRAGLRDLWRAGRKDAREWTWRSSASGFRLDHAVGNQALVDRMGPIAARYDHQPRESAFTDHSALIVELTVPSI